MSESGSPICNETQYVNVQSIDKRKNKEEKNQAKIE